MVTFYHLKVEINGSEPFTSFSGFSLSQSYDWHHTFEVKVPLDDVESAGTNNLSRSRDFIGKSVKFEITQPGTSGKLLTFNGVVTDISMARFGGAASELILRGYSPTIMFEQGINSKAYINMSLSNLFQVVTSKYPRQGISYRVSCNPDPQFEYTLQLKESAYNFLARMANRYGKWFFFDGKDCVFGSLPSGDPVELHFGSDLLDFHLGMKLAANKFKTKSYDYINNQQLSSGPANVSNLDSQGKFAFNQSESYFFEEQTYATTLSAKNAGDVNDIAAARRAAIAAGLVVLSGSSANPKLKVGGTIKVKADAAEGVSGGTTDYGNYTVITVSHSMDGAGNYHNTFEAIPSSVSVPLPNRNVQLPSCEIQPAKVVQNDDPEGYGRLKIMFYWQDDSPTNWVRFVSPHAGQNRGMQFLPEVGDEVLVSFEGNNPDRPVVIGSLYHGKANHKDRKDNDNNIKTIRTNSGNEIKFADKSGEEEIMIMNKESGNLISLSLKGDGKIYIKSKGKIELEAQEIAMTAQKDFTIDAMNLKVSTKQKTSFDAKQAFEVGSTEVKLEAKSDAKLTGLNVTVEGQVAAKVAGQASAELSASGKTTVRGGMVMIN